MKSSSPRMRWAMITLVFWATAINYLDRQTLSVVAPLLRDEFHMSNAAYSRVVSAFMLAYTFMNGLSGPFLDRVGTRLGYAIIMAWWSASAMLHAAAKDAWSLAAYRFLLGGGEAGNWPGGVKVVAEWFPVRERALASGIFNSGSAVGAILAPPLVAYIVVKLNWQWAFIAVGACGFVWLIFWCLLYRTPPLPKAEMQTPVASPWQLLRTRFVWTFTLSKVFIDPVWYFFIFWFPEYLRRQRHFDISAIGKYAWIPFFVAGIGNLLGGALCSVLLKHGLSLTQARKTSVTLFNFLMCAAIPAVFVADVRLSIAFVSLATAGYTGSMANMLAFPADVFPKNTVGSVYGLASMGAGFGGMIFSLLTGWAVDQWSYVPVFIGFGIIPMIGSLIIWTLLGPLQPEAKVLVRDVS